MLRQLNFLDGVVLAFGQHEAERVRTSLFMSAYRIEADIKVVIRVAVGGRTCGSIHDALRGTGRRLDVIRVWLSRRACRSPTGRGRPTLLSLLTARSPAKAMALMAKNTSD